MKNITFILFLFFSSFLIAQSPEPAFESFNFTGALNANGWTTHSGTSGQLQTITTPANSGASLYYNNLPLSAGNRAQLVAGNSEDVNKAITGISGQGFFSFLINIPNTTAMNPAGEHFISFGASASSFAAKVYVKPGSAPNTVKFGILNTTGIPTYGTEDYPCATTHFIVVKLKATVVTPPSLAQASIWVNPTPGSTEPVATAINAAGSSAFSTFALLILRQAGSLATSTTTGNIELDEIRYGSSWSSVTPLNTASCITYAISNVAKCVSYDFNNQVYTTSGTYMVTLSNANSAGCDSIITLNLIIKQPSFSTVNVTNCGAYTMNGQTFTSTGQYTQTLVDGNSVGCDSTITLNLNIVSSINYYQDLDGDGYGNSNITASSCSPNPGFVAIGGDCNDNNSQAYPGATDVPENGVDEDCNGQDAPLLPVQLGTYQFTGTTNCPSADNAVFAQPSNGTFSLFSTLNTTCSSSAGVFNNSAWNQSASIDLNEYNEFSVSASACNKLRLDRIAFHHRASSTGGTPTWVIRSSLDNFSSNIGSGLSGNNGGVNIDDTVYLGASFQSIVNVTFRFYLIGMGSSSATWRMDNVSLFGNIVPITTPILQTATISSSATSICAGTTISFASNSINTWPSSTSYQWQLNNTDILGATSSTYSSANFSNSDTVRVVISSSLSCIANPVFISSGIGLSVLSSSTNATAVSACDSYSWNGQTYTASGTYTGATTNCVTETLNLTINPSSTNSISQSACDSYVWNGTTYNTSGVYTGETVNCVTESLNLTITPSTTNTTAATACDSYIWNGQIYTASGTYTGATANCVTESLNLTITSSTTNTTQVSATGSYTWSENGQTYTTSGIYAGSTSNCITQSLDLTIVHLATNATLALNIFIDGYHINNSSPAVMVPARYTNLVASGSSNPGAATDVDMVTVQLRSPSNLEVVAYSVNAILQTNGSLLCVFPAGAINGSYYIVVLHRAANPVWSANPVAITASSSYSFSNSVSSAYGVSSQHQLSTNLYGLWLGELNDDGYIDGTDFSMWQIDAILSESGQYLLDGDFNGDSYVDPSDYPVFDINSQEGVEAQRPY